jgi:hypothetical protein
MQYAKIFGTGLMSASLSLAVVSPVSAHDELYYSAADCKPVNAGHWNGSGAEGFEWVGNSGGWYNFDHDEMQILVCPVPYFRDVNDLAPIVVRAVIDDKHNDSLASASLCRKAADASAPVCASADNFPTVVGLSTIELSVTPDVNTRFVFLEVRIPDDDDDNAFAGTGTSGLIGYRVFRD